MLQASSPQTGAAGVASPPPTATALRTAAGGLHQLDSPVARAADPALIEGPSAHVARGGGNHGLGQPLPPPDQGTREPQPAAAPHRTPGSISLTADGSAHGGQHYWQGQQLGRTHSSPQLANAAAAAQQQQQQQQQREGSRREEGSRRGGAVWVLEDGSAKAGRAWQPAHDSVDSVRAARVAHTANKPVGPAGAGGKGGFGHAVVQVEEADERKLFEWGTYFSSLPKKLKGGLDTRLPVPSWRELFWSWLGAFLGTLAVCALNQWCSPEIDIAFLVGSFGASAVLVFAMLESKMAQPRNFVGGQILSAVVGVTTRVIIHPTWIAGPVGMSLALFLMQLTSTTHPPGGATALIASTMATLPKWHGYSFIITVLVGSLVMQAIALVINNLDPKRRYPTFWW